MSFTIYVGGEIKAAPITNKDDTNIIAIRNSCDEQAFTLNNRTQVEIEGELGASYSFYEDTHISSAPYEDEILAPLTKLLEYFKERNIKSEGKFVIESPDTEFNNITINIIDGELVFGNTEILNAKTEDLLDELKKRSVLDDETLEKIKEKMAAEEECDYEM